MSKGIPWSSDELNNAKSGAIVKKVEDFVRCYQK